MTRAVARRPAPPPVDVWIRRRYAAEDVLRLHRPLAALVGLAMSAAGLLAPGRAAADEHEWHAGLGFGYASLSGATNSNGFGGGLHLAYGLDDTWNLIGDVDATAHPSSQWTVVSGGIGAAYVIDVLRWVPWIGAELGPAAVVSTDPQCGLASLEPCASFRLGLAIPFGLDYRISKSFSVGAGGRFEMLVLGPTPWTLLGVFARAEYTWGARPPHAAPP